MRDGRVALSRRVVPPMNIERAARGRLYGDAGFGGGGFGRRGGGPDRGFPPNEDFGRRGGPPPGGGGGFGRPPNGAPTFEFANVVLAGSTAGVVAVPVDPPPLSVAMHDLGPTLAFAALGLLVAGTAVGALLVFRPTHRRLRELQDAAQALGSGETSVRAPETGGDEVTALAHAFNEMAGRLEQRTQALEAAGQARRQLVADVSHELTTPLAAIRGYVETLAMPDLELDRATRSRYLQIVIEETERLGDIVGDLLDVARLEGGGGSLAIETVPVARLLERLRDRHEQLIREKNIVLQTMQPAGELTVRADANRLEQAVQNLVSNAVRHTPPGGTVSVSAEPADAGVRIVVQDTGPGIPPEHLPRVFDRFYKVDVSRTGTAEPSGSGLGLSIVRAIVERHGGRVTAGNGPAGGARFEIVLPGAAQESPAPALAG